MKTINTLIVLGCLTLTAGTINAVPKTQPAFVPQARVTIQESNELPPLLQSTIRSLKGNADIEVSKTTHDGQSLYKVGFSEACQSTFLLVDASGRVVNTL